MNQPPNFDRLTRPYRWMEFFSFGPFLSQTRRAFLSELGGCRRALVLGDGDGRFTARLLQTNPQIRIDAVDASEAMLRALLRRAGPDASRVTTHLADARTWQPDSPDPDGEYDLVATHFFLDCLTPHEVETLAANISKWTTSDCLWVLSEFAIPTGWFGRLVAIPIVTCLYLAFGWLTGLKVRALPDHAIALQKAGIRLTEQRARLGGLLVSELWSFNRFSRH